ncbi:unnamed protein product [Linum tenue]|uniref:Uncharacterized protein n=1 Tax=Linum tenue TaxID=586396 RepID=A0AAV0SAJ1_9ROSI|nr:unnamed protein product [Linum tenue]
MGQQLTPTRWVSSSISRRRVSESGRGGLLCWWTTSR